MSAQPQLQPATDSDKCREATYKAAVADISWFSKYLCPKQAFHTKYKNQHFSPFWTLMFLEQTSQFHVVNVDNGQADPYFERE